MKVEGFSEVVNSIWNEATTHANPLLRLDMKLRAMVEGLQRWSQQKVGNIRDQILMANEIIFRLDAAQDTRQLNTPELWLRRKLKLRVLGLASLERTIARQRARIAGVKEGDANPLFFRIHASSHRRRTFCARLRDDDRAATEQEDKEDLAATFFTRLLGQATPRAHDIDLEVAGRPRDVQPILDRLANKLALWKAKLLSIDGRLIYIQMIMTSSLVYHLLALDLEPWVFSYIDKLRRSFLWAGPAECRGGHCLVAWPTVCQPKRIGGLGLHNLKMLNAALRAKWIWASRTDLDRPWVGLQIPTNQLALDIFNASTAITVGTGSAILFWQDPWLQGLSAGCIASEILSMVRPSIIRMLSVQEWLDGDAWVRGIAGVLSVDATVQFFRLWEAVRRVAPSGEADAFRWKWSAARVFSARSAYQVFFIGRTTLPGAAQLWNAFAPLRFKVFGWLALRGRCWSADRMARHGLTCHLTCPLCGIEDETLNHILLQCRYARAIWFRFLQRRQWEHLAPLADSAIVDWWPDAEQRLQAKDRKSFNSMVLLVSRSIWLQRNARVFDRDDMPAHTLLELVDSEWLAWQRCRCGSLREID
ncbi:hypothetical protein ACQ4PT_007069 [Festuca glaucescens]